MASLGNQRKFQAAQGQRGKEEGLQTLPQAWGRAEQGRDQACFEGFEDGAVWSVKTPWRGQDGTRAVAKWEPWCVGWGWGSGRGRPLRPRARLMESGDRLGTQVRRAGRSQGGSLRVRLGQGCALM